MSDFMKHLMQKFHAKNTMQNNGSDIPCFCTIATVIDNAIDIKSPFIQSSAIAVWLFCCALGRESLNPFKVSPCTSPKLAAFY